MISINLVSINVVSSNVVSTNVVSTNVVSTNVVSTNMFSTNMDIQGGKFALVDLKSTFNTSEICKIMVFPGPKIRVMRGILALVALAVVYSKLHM